MSEARLGLERTTDPVGMRAESPASAGGFYRFEVGQLRCLAVSDGAGPTNPSTVYGTNVPDEKVGEVLRARYLSPSEAAVNITALMVDTGRQTVLVDAGLGQMSGPNGESVAGSIAENLSAAGTEPGDVDVVCITHFHGDHVGGLFDERGEFVFPNARYVLPRAEWKFWMETSASQESLRMPEGFKRSQVETARNLLPRLADRLELFEADAEILPGIRSIPAPGHTPGHVALEISDAGEKLLHVTDAFMHQVITPEHPNWHFAIDLDAEQAVRTRRSLLEKAAQEGTLVIAYHFPWPAMGHVFRQGDAYAWAPIEWRWRA